MTNTHFKGLKQEFKNVQNSHILLYHITNICLRFLKRFYGGNQFLSWISKTYIVLPVKWTFPTKISTRSFLQYKQFKKKTVFITFQFPSKLHFVWLTLGAYFDTHTLIFFRFGNHLSFRAKVFFHLKPKTIICNHLLLRYEAFTKLLYNITI